MKITSVTTGCIGMHLTSGKHTGICVEFDFIEKNSKDAELLKKFEKYINNIENRSGNVEKLKLELIQMLINNTRYMDVDFKKKIINEIHDEIKIQKEKKRIKEL